MANPNPVGYFNSENAALNTRKGHIARKSQNGLKQAFKLQNLCFESAVSLEKRIHESKKGITREDAYMLSLLVRSWESCQERIRIHKGKPMPGSLRPETPNNRAIRRTAIDRAVIKGEFAELDQYTSENPVPKVSESASEDVSS